MRFRTALCGLVAASAFALWSCGGCRGPEGTEMTPVPEARAYEAPASPDAARPDLRPDTTAPVCGGSRRIKPLEVRRTSGFACGNGCRQVTFGEDVKEYDVAGDLLVYSGNIGLERKVYLVDLKQDREWLIHRGLPKRPGCFTVATDGSTIAYSCSVWPDSSAKSYVQALHRFDPASGIERDLQCWVLVVGQHSTPDWLGMGTDGIVVDMSFASPSGAEAFFYRYSDQSLTNLSQREKGVLWTRISGQRVVWTQDWDYGAPPYTQIVLYDTQTKKKGYVAPFAGHQYTSRIKGDKVVWVDNRNSPGNLNHYNNLGNSDIYVHDLGTGKTSAACTNRAQQDCPDVEQDLVVWEDWRNNKPTPTPKFGSEYQNSDIYMKDLRSGKEYQITAFAAKGKKDLESMPRIDRRRVFFRMSTPKILAVFMIELDRAFWHPGPSGHGHGASGTGR